MNSTTPNAYESSTILHLKGSFVYAYELAELIQLLKDLKNSTPKYRIAEVCTDDLDGIHSAASAVFHMLDEAIKNQ